METCKTPLYFGRLAYGIVDGLDLIGTRMVRINAGFHRFIDWIDLEYTKNRKVLNPFFSAQIRVIRVPITFANMKIHILGASGSGVTTLGKALTAQLNFPYFDSDDFYWEKSDPPFTIKRNQQEREKLVDETLAKHPSYILGGSIIGWGEQWLRAFDVVVFLYLPPAIRLNRLRKREFERYGDIIFTNAYRNDLYEKFIVWAAGYDENNIVSGTRTLANHEAWLKKLACKLIEIRGDFTVEERIDMVIKNITELQDWYANHLNLLF